MAREEDAAWPPSGTLRNPVSLARKIRGSEGVVILRDLPAAPMKALRSLMSGLAARPELRERANAAASRTWSESGGSAVLDLSQERLGAIDRADADLRRECAALGLSPALEFWAKLEREIVPALSRVVAVATGDAEAVLSDVSTTYRLVDSTRRSARRDVGTYTLVWADAPGFQVRLAGDWRDLPCGDDPLLLFGMCTQIRSNDRIPARLHRLADAPTSRLAATLVVAPACLDTTIEPFVLPKENRRYRPGLSLRQLRRPHIDPYSRKLLRDARQDKALKHARLRHR